MRTTHPTTDPRRHALGLLVLALTLGCGYVLAQRAPVSAVVGQVEATDVDDDGEDEREALSVGEIMAEIETIAARYHVPARLVAAIVAEESEFNPRAVSRKGAQGLMQLMPATAASVDVRDSFDARANLEGGVRHLRALMDRYQSDLPLVLAAYNAGDRAVLAYGGVPPYPETRRYVLRVLRRYDPEAARAASRRLHRARRALTVPTSDRVVYRGVATPAVLRVPAREMDAARAVTPVRDGVAMREVVAAREAAPARDVRPAHEPGPVREAAPAARSERDREVAPARTAERLRGEAAPTRAVMETP